MFDKLLSLGRKNSMFASSVNLMLSSGLVAVFGFVFWIVVARSYPSAAVGLATTLLSASSFIALLGLAGFDTVFLRFLKKSEDPNILMNSGLGITAIITALLSAVFCYSLHFFAPKLIFVEHNPIYILLFIVVTVLANWNILTNSVLVALRRTSLVLSINIIFSVIKLLLPFVIPATSPIALFAIVGLAQLVNVLLSLVAMMKYLGYRPSFKIDFGMVRQNLKYGTAVYTANLLNLLPDFALPLIVVNKLGAAAAAYFYIAFTVANLLYTIAFSTTQVLLAEVSADEESLIQHFRKGLVIVAGLLMPAILLAIVFCPYVLTSFGHDYRNGATGLLRLLAISGIAVALYASLGTFFKLTHNLKGVIAAPITNAITIPLLSLALVPRLGLLGIGWAWLLGSFCSVLVGMIFFWIRSKPKPPNQTGLL